MIPEQVKDEIDRHVKVGCPCGDFVTAVLENNLKESFKCADDENIVAMRDIVAYVYNEVPMLCWGSKEKVMEWQRKGGHRGAGIK